MLITKGVAVGEVITLKLSTGEELVGKLAEDTAEYVAIERPLTLVAGQGGLGLQPWLFTVDADKTFKIGKDKVMTMQATMKQMADSYLSGTSGIALA